jgi:hypothetical protein
MSKEKKEQFQKIIFDAVRCTQSCTAEKKHCLCENHSKSITDKIYNDISLLFGSKPEPGTIIEEDLPDGGKAWTCY